VWSLYWRVPFPYYCLYFQMQPSEMGCEIDSLAGYLQNHSWILYSQRWRADISMEPYLNVFSTLSDKFLLSQWFHSLLSLLHSLLQEVDYLFPHRLHCPFRENISASHEQLEVYQSLQASADRREILQQVFEFWRFFSEEKTQEWIFKYDQIYFWMIPSTYFISMNGQNITSCYLLECHNPSSWRY
jgi:hypothetical protein